MTHKEVLLSLVGIGQNKGGGGGDVPAVIEPLSVTENGVYTAPAGTDGYSPVTVDVPGPSGTKTITANGTHDVAEYASAEVNVPQPSGSTTITENGTYDVTDKAQAVVNVPSSGDKSVGLIDGTATTYENSEITKVVNSPFQNNKTITSVSLPNVTEISRGSAFYGTENLKSLNLPKLKTVTNTSVFSDMGVEDLVLPELITVNNYAFECMYSVSPCLKTIKLPAFYSAIPIAGTSDLRTFASQENLTTVDVGTPGQTLSYNVSKNDFNNCKKLTQLIIRYNRLATLSGTNAFTKTPIASGTGYIYVPSALVSQYQAATNWSTYSAQFRALEDYTVDGTTAGALDPTKI